MEHIRQFDWFSQLSEPDVYFIKDEDMVHSVTEKILRNKFHDPAIVSSDSDGESVNINWDEIFSKKQNVQFEKFQRLFVPCLTTPPPYPKLSALDGKQHYQCLRVLCAENPHILPEEFMPRPTKSDLRVFEEVKQKYEVEQKEYIEWAKTLWTTNHCVRALHPKPHVEMVYEARFKMRANEMNSYPKTYDMAAQIPLETANGSCTMVFDKDIKTVDITTLPQIEVRPITHKFSIIRACNVPEPCTKHPCKFILPNEKSVSILPLTEVQRELAQFGVDNGAHYVASENALKCLVEHDRPWDISVAVCSVIGLDGETSNVVVLGSEFSVRKEAVLVRTYRAYRHLLQHSLIPPSERPKLNYKDSNDTTAKESSGANVPKVINTAPDPDVTMDDDSDDEDNSLCIDVGAMDNLFGSEDDTGQNDKTPNDTQDNENTVEITSEDTQNNKTTMEITSEETQNNKTAMEITSKDTQNNKTTMEITSEETQNNKDTDTSDSKNSKQDDPMDEDHDDFYNCTCKGSVFERPPPRSFRKWQVKNSSTGENYNVIVHCAHKVRDKNGEVLLEPIPEYQLELGASAQPPSRIRSLALSLHLRTNASLLNVRVDGDSGEVATFESMSGEDLQREHGDVMRDVTGALHSAFSQLQGLLPGNYVLRHEPSHGSNALLYAARSAAQASFTLDFDCTKLQDTDESKNLKTPPTMVPVMLPFHKFRKMLPCAFTPHPSMMAREPRRRPLRNKTPPRALQWPKRKGKKKKNTASN